MVLLPNSLLKRLAELEFAGEVVDADASTGFAPGDKVAGFVAPDAHITQRRGALAQYIVVKPAEIVKRPDFLTTVEASGVIGVALTAYQALFEVAKLRQEPGQSVFINGGSTSVGMYAIQIAKSYGLKVVASTSGRNAKLVEELGAEVCTSRSFMCRADHWSSARSSITPSPHFTKLSLNVSGQISLTHSSKRLVWRIPCCTPTVNRISNPEAPTSHVDPSPLVSSLLWVLFGTLYSAHDGSEVQKDALRE